MDSRDLSTITRDGDEDGLIAATYGLGREAYSLFQSRRYSECIDVLHQLLQMKKNDQKVLHNLIVAEYNRDGCSDPRKVLEDLNNIKKTCNERARASEEQLEALGNYGNSSSGSKGSGTTHHQLSASDTSIAYIDEYDTSITSHNIAVILYRLHEYANAQSVLEPLYQNIEPIEESTAVHICLVLVDIALASQNATKVLEVLMYLEKAIGGGYLNSQGGDNNSNTQQPHYSPHPPPKTHSAPNNSTTLDISAASDSSPNPPRENSHVRTVSDENYENFLSNLDSSGQILSTPPGFSSSNDVPKPSLDQSVPDLDLKLKLHLYKVRLLILTKNLKAAKREVKNFMNIARGRDSSSTALLLKSELEYARGNYRKAVRLLMTSPNRTEPGMAGMFNSNLGCIYHQLKKHHASTVLYTKALKSCSQIRSEKPLKLQSFSQDQSLRMVYNCGLQYLICGKPITAAQCFQKAGLVYYDKPLLWLRIAECCLLALEKGLLVGPTPNKDVKLSVIGEGKWRQLAVNEDYEQKNMDHEEQQNNKLSVLFARQCLFNALHLLNTTESKSNPNHSTLPRDVEDDSSSNHKETKDSKAVVNLNAILHSSVSVYEHICRTQNTLIKQAVLADLAYTELSLSNPLKALSASRDLLNLEECSRIYTFLGRIYAAEALCQLNRLKDAAEYLSIYIPDGTNADIPFSEEDTETWESENVVDESSGTFQKNLVVKPSEASGAVYVNFAAMLAVQGLVEQAHEVMSKGLALIPKNRKAILCAAYVDLLMGKAQEALGKLKECTHVRTVPTGIKL